MISIPLQRVKMEYNPVKSWTVSRPPLYRSNPKNKIITERWVINGLNMVKYLNNQNFLIIISLPFKRTLSPRRVKNSLNWGVCSVFPKICSSVNWFSFTQITPTLSSDLMKTYLQVDGLKLKNITARIINFCFNIFKGSMKQSYTWSSLSNSSEVSGSWPKVNGGFRFISLPREATTSSRLYLSAKTELVGINPWML